MEDLGDRGEWIGRKEGIRIEVIVVEKRSSRLVSEGYRRCIRVCEKELTKGIVFE